MLGVGGILLGFGLWQLAGCSFVMSSAHGAGLMLVPAFVFPVDEHVSALDLHRVSRTC